ncbi:hypothetical protein DMX10_14000 [Pseudomonas sp. 57B-090624]|uniref:hypothetical protein n=1 Tax=Pseudomonas sp. 57B-090624 TaxID=2213080 RepID=UPI000DA8A5C1|nr:hypothetical protein [Pseudomonas sp. 57B-090624]PZE12739.1 hypothetical protein DMX10_14000 [Pseudomonas sp. 57B-090624]
MSSWTNQKPTVPGAYYIRGFRLGEEDSRPALVEIDTDGDELICNLHCSNSEDEFSRWDALAVFSGDFEWLGPLLSTPPAAQVQGEQPEVVAWRSENGSYTEDRQVAEQRNAHREDPYLPLMTVAQHERMAAAMVEHYRAQFSELHVARNLLSRLSRAGIELGDDPASSIIAALSAPPAAGVLEQMSEEARSTLVGMVEFCLERRYCMGMDEGFASFEPETEHGFVKELRAFVEGAPTPPASEQQQAVQQPHTVEFVGKTCQRVLMAEGKPYPRTCAVCGLSGPCKSFPRESDLRLNPHLAGVNQGVTTEAGNGGDA